MYDDQPWSKEEGSNHNGDSTQIMKMQVDGRCKRGLRGDKDQSGNAMIPICYVALCAVSDSDVGYNDICINICNQFLKIILAIESRGSKRIRGIERKK